MTIYIFMLGWVVIWGIMSQIISPKVCIGNEVYEKRVHLFMAIMTFSVIIFFAGLRSGVADTTAYIICLKIIHYYQMRKNLLQIQMQENQDLDYFLY